LDETSLHNRGMSVGLNKRCCDFFYETPVSLFQAITTSSIVEIQDPFTWNSPNPPSPPEFYRGQKS